MARQVGSPVTGRSLTVGQEPAGVPVSAGMNTTSRTRSNASGALRASCSGRRSTGRRIPGWSGQSSLPPPEPRPSQAGRDQQCEGTISWCRRFEVSDQGDASQPPNDAVSRCPARVRSLRPPPLALRKDWTGNHTGSGARGRWSATVDTLSWAVTDTGGVCSSAGPSDSQTL